MNDQLLNNLVVDEVKREESTCDLITIVKDDNYKEIALTPI